MPYIAVKAYPKDRQTQIRLAEEINAAVLRVWGCKPEAVTVSLESIPPEDWPEKVDKAQVAPVMDSVLIYKGQKRY